MKSERQNKIIQLIRNNDIETQEELANALVESGFNVTQATVSRDIRELKLTKTSMDGKHQKYVLYRSSDSQLSGKYENVLREGFISMVAANNLVVVKTVSGMAMAVCAAIDAFEFTEEIGSIAGDDTIMIAASSNEDAVVLMEKVNSEMRR